MCTVIATQELSFVVAFLKDEKNISSKIMDVRENNSFLKTVEAYKTHKDQKES
jgi:hypothetical protein